MRNIIIYFSIFVFLTSFLVFIFWGVNSLQNKHKKSQAHIEAISQQVGKEQKIMEKQTLKDLKVSFSFIFADKKLETDPLKIGEYDPTNYKTVKTDMEIIKNVVDSIPEILSTEPQIPASVEKNKNGKIVKILRGKINKVIDRKKTLSMLLAKLENINDLLTSNGHGFISISLEVPTKYNDNIESIDSLRYKLGFSECIAEFETKHDEEHSKDENRNKNLQIACEKIDGLILYPGAEFSFNRIVGPRTRKQGFLPAGVISNGRVIPGLGGGVCQVSTTLYRCALLSGMKILERHNHSIYEGISYAERGLDAAVVYGVKDFRFLNSTDLPILILCESSPGKVKVMFYAERKPYEKVEVYTKNEVKIPYEIQIKRNPNLKAGEKKIIHPGVTGYKIEAYRIVTIKGIKKEELLSKDNYLTFPRIEEVNN